MNSRVCELYNFFTSKAHRSERRTFDENLAEEFSRRALTPTERVSERLSRLMRAERALIFPGERIAFTRTISNIPPIFTEAEWAQIRSKHFLHEAGSVCNISPGYEEVIRTGLGPARNQAISRLDEQLTPDQRAFYKAVVMSIDAVLELTERYRAEAERMGNGEISGILARVPLHGARSFHEALQAFRILHFTLWLEGEYHNTVGRFDQYMYPYYKADIDSGALTREQAFELLEEFFLSFNKDSDLYMGVQQGDNGQSLVLGGLTEDGTDGFNPLSELCLMASKDLKLIDPKINMRVSGKTPFAQYELGTQLTKDGLGFPQYENDDVVIDGLIQKGYSPQDARNYVVAACWEFIIPRYGMDIPNIGALSYPLAVERTLKEKLIGCESFDALMDAVAGNIARQCDQICQGLDGLWMVPAPFMSIMMDDCLQTGRDISLGARYNNYGIHGTGLSTAADSLAAIEKYVFTEKTLSAETLMEALDKNFEGFDELVHMLRFEAPKMGTNDDAVDSIAVRLMGDFAKALEGKVNERGGVFRAGTGSAMFYLWHAAEVGASADGRKKGEAFGANFSPSLHAKIDGPLSVIQSFTKPDLARTINGGPLTIELHQSVFAEDSGVGKVAALVQKFIQLGGHQLQLNAVNRETLLDAQRSPEDYKQLIVRVWGWSAYFVELDKDYQDHVIRRQEHMT
jgi:pyruvate-formate lyase